jgi:hypothetical protein
MPPCACVCIAGRRGKDDRGMVLLMVDDALEEPTARWVAHVV